MGAKKKLVARILKSEPLILKSKPLIFHLPETRLRNARKMQTYSDMAFVLLRNMRFFALFIARCSLPLARISKKQVKSLFLKE